MLHSPHATNPSRKFGTQQVRVGSYVSQSAHGGKLLGDRVGCQSTRFEVHAVSRNHDTVEGESRLGAVPCYELIEGKLVNAARSG